MNFDTAFDKLLGHEGGYSDHPDDTGGKTMWGITEAVARRVGYRGDMRDLPVDLAKQIARREYWDTVNADLVPDAVRFDLFDAAYNSDPVQAIRWLQRAVYVTADGVFGPKTLLGVQTYNPQAIAARFNGHRLDTLNDLGNWKSFGRGWAQRVAENLIAVKG